MKIFLSFRNLFFPFLGILSQNVKVGPSSSSSFFTYGVGLKVLLELDASKEDAGQVWVHESGRKIESRK